MLVLRVALLKSQPIRRATATNKSTVVCVAFNVYMDMYWAMQHKTCGLGKTIHLQLYTRDFNIAGAFCGE